MRILFTYLTFGKNIFGGVERSTYNLALGLRSIGVDIHIYTSRMWNGSCLVDGIQVYFSRYLKSRFDDRPEDIDRNIRYNYEFYSLEIKTELQELIERVEPDYVLAVDHLWGILPFVDIWDKLECPAGLVFQKLHNHQIINEASKLPFKHFFSVSNYLTKGLRNICPTLLEKEIYLLPNSIILDSYNLNNIQKKKNTIFCNCRLSEEKGVEFLMQAFKKVVKTKSDTYLLLCGGKFHFGDNSGIIESIIRKSEENQLKSNMEILPLLDWDEVPEYIKMAQLVVLPSKIETFGIAALEAMASGTALIATKVGNLPDLVEDSGILIEFGDVEMLTDEIIKVLSSESSTLSMIEQGKKNSEKYDYIIVAKKFLEIIRT